ncbi:glycoside hydrolase family 78 protein [Karstenula rhodostoma CBS 690.94]|uniref:Glycoside hydrolase family 78 protein n=1 Tax=Karstenula rhodostoma CBS 690.94 TaxID=1392251 RepID=A0A9P4PUP9_9PLEO|nr:glycoside hydrolase family 78 protein [Karstenula rhodostoma CBS 690.94]
MKCAGFFLLSLVAATAPNPWDNFIYSPASRHVKPTIVHTKSEPITISKNNDGEIVYDIPAGSQVSLDFGIEVGGWISLHANTTSSNTPQLSLAFAESPSFVRAISDDTGSVATQDYDKALNLTLAEGSTWYRVPEERFRGGFRFLTIRALSEVTVTNITCEIGFATKTKDLRKYPGYFYTPDADQQILNRAWYAGAYTVQTNIAPQNTGRYLPQVKNGWAYNSSIGIAGPLLVDGAKRDRAVWPGDLGIQGATAFLSLGHDGLVAYKNALETLFYYQNATTGRFPFAGPATGSFRNGAQSDTYHAWSLIAMHNYAIFTGDSAWLDLHWANITRGIEFITNALDTSYGLHKQTAPNDWARQGGGGYNSALNALDYQALSSLSTLAQSWSRDPTTLDNAAKWATAAAKLKRSYNALLWDTQTSLFHDNETTTLTPQDGNALALLYNLTTTPSHATALSAALTKFWTPIGPITPELPDTISPFISSIELLAHFAANEPARALNLTHSLWTYLLDSPLMTGSTLAEGISANGSLYYRGNAGYKHDAAYTSLSHGWSTGPTQALSFRLAGLEIVGWKRWVFRPQSGGVKSVRSGFESPLGAFGQSIGVPESGLSWFVGPADGFLVRMLRSRQSPSLKSQQRSLNRRGPVRNHKNHTMSFHKYLLHVQLVVYRNALDAPWFWFTQPQCK